MKRSKRVKILVTGGAGFIGSHIVDLLIARGHDVIVVDNLSTGKKEDINKQARFYQIDINDSDLKNVFKVEKPEYIFHQAAQISVSNSVKFPRMDAQCNIMGLLNLLEFSIQNKIKGVVFASSGGTVYGEPATYPINETNTLSPKSPYGISKMTSEYYLDFYFNQYHLNYISLRYGNVYGPRQDPDGEAGVIAIFIRKMLRGEIPVINGDGEYIRDYVYVEDVANACLLSMENMLKLSELRRNGLFKKPFNSFNVASGKGVSVNQLYSYLKKIMKSTILANYGLPRPGDLRKNILDCALAGEYLSWSPRYHLQEGLKKTVKWFKEKY